MNRKTISAILMLGLCVAMCVGAIPSGALEGTAPIAENLEISTYRGVSVSGKLSAFDPENSLMSYIVVTEPRKGRLEISAEGDFVYTPDMGKRGKDYFGYKACDADGNYSQEATVIIRIEKQKTAVSYSDMRGSGGEYAALALAEHGIFIGECIGGNHLFDPGRSVTRGQFLAMCLALSDIEPLSGVTRTGFADDTAIPVWVKPYVSTALLSGVISGYSGTEGATFGSEADITYAEAAVLLNRILGIADVRSASSVNAEVVPAWAYQATVNLTACRVLPGSASEMDACLTRSDAATLLINAMTLH